jgi:hypothetical protein
MRISLVLSGSLKSVAAGVARFGIAPKYFCASAKPWAGLTSPAIASTALFGP